VIDFTHAQAYQADTGQRFNSQVSWAVALSGQWHDPCLNLPINQLKTYAY